MKQNRCACGREAVEILLEWFRMNKRPLPWRESYSPYSVYISEMMLQQTQMERGVAYYLRWMEKFPDIAALADAGEAEVLAAWEGLGYYSRARNLHKAAKTVVSEYGGVIPSDPAELEKLPGIGAYTAAAIAGIAYNRDVAVTDTNVVRVFSRLFDIADKDPKPKAAALAQELLPSGKAREYDQALMEFGALVCRKDAACLKGEECPLKGLCRAFACGTVRERPLPKASPKRLNVASAFLIITDESGRMALRQRPSGGLWAGLWEFPGIERESEGKAAPFTVGDLTAAFGLACAPLAVGSVSYSYTCHSAKASYFRIAAKDIDALPEGFSFRETDGAAFPAHHRKALDLLEKCSLLFRKGT